MFRFATQWHRISNLNQKVKMCFNEWVSERGYCTIAGGKTDIWLRNIHSPGIILIRNLNKKGLQRQALRLSANCLSSFRSRLFPPSSNKFIDHVRFNTFRFPFKLREKLSIINSQPKQARYSNSDYRLHCTLYKRKTSFVTCSAVYVACK
jgi:hypothetical protein